MIKCPDCGADNLLGAIFCRGCGEKLDIDNLKPDQLEDKSKKAAKNTVKVVRNLVTLLIMLTIGAIVAGVIIPPGYDKPSTLTEEQETQARAAFKTLANTANGGATLSYDDLNFFAPQIAQLTPDENEARKQEAIEAGEEPKIVAETIFVQPIPPDQVRFVLKTKAMGKVPLYFSISGPITVAESGGMTFSPTTLTIGRIPMFGSFLQQLVTDQFTPLTTGNEQFTKSDSKIFSKVKKMEMTDTTVTLQK